MFTPKEIIKSRRQTIALVIDNDGELIVRAPFYATTRDIDFFIAEKQNWIAQKSLEMKQKNATFPVVNFENGESIYYMGKECVIEKTRFGAVHFDEEEATFYLPSDEKIKDKLVAWYKKRASVFLKSRVRFYAQIMGVEPTGVSITSAKTRWGSCSYNDKLNFTWRLMMCPPEVIDYVVVHELSHIEHKDHSKAFWKCVEATDAKYKEHEKWLTEHQRLMYTI